jgi:integrase
MEDLVFAREEGKPLVVDTLQRQFIEPALTRAGLRRFTIHQLRHTYATLLIKAGVPLPYISKQLGHSSIKITVDTTDTSSLAKTLPGQIAWIRRQLPKNPQTRRKQRDSVGK